MVGTAPAPPGDFGGTAPAPSGDFVSTAPAPSGDFVGTVPASLGGGDGFSLSAIITRDVAAFLLAQLAQACIIVL